jgi:hypothetical protein
MKARLLKIFTLVYAPFAMFAGSSFATTDLTVGQISDRYFGDVLIIPAGYAFSIWGLIYLGLLALAVVQALPSWGERERIAAARVPLVANLTFNFAWLAAWQSLQFELATLILFGQLATGIWLYYRLRTPFEAAHSRLEAWLRVPVSVYVGWLTLASVLGVSSLLRYWGWEGGDLSFVAWTVIMLFVSAGLGAYFRFAWRDPVYAGVYVWALVAIALRPEQAGLVVMVALFLAAFFVAIILLGFSKRFRQFATPVVPSMVR